ncbi:MAG: hypothetical protein ACYCS7_14810 [Acidimicrobiales bacterium]
MFFRPGRRLKEVRCKVLMLSGDADTVCPPGPEPKAPRGLANVRLETGSFNHFDPFLRRFDELIQPQVGFLRGELALTK